MIAEKGPNEKNDRNKSSEKKSSTYAVPKWLAWVAGLVMACLLVLAITLPLTLKKEKSDATQGQCRAQGYIQRYDIFDSDPFDELESSSERSLSNGTVNVDRLRSIWDSLTFEDRLGQLSQWSNGDFSGPSIIDNTDESWEELIAQGNVGSMLNLLNVYRVNKYQQTAKTAGKLPILFGFDVIHGYATIFPINLGMAAAFDRKMIYDYAAIAAKEQLEDGISWTFAPMVDIARDPRWGRMSESAGEDPFLTGELGIQYVKGFQDNGVAACVKHLVAYGGAQAGRDYHTVELSDASLFNDFLPSYKKAMDAGALSGMGSFNTIKGIPSHANREMMIDVIRGLWQYKGMIVSDYGAIRELVAHAVAKDIPDAAVLSLTAGVDMAMADAAYLTHINTYIGRDGHSWDEVLEDGHTLREYVEYSAKRILIMKEKMGLFDTDGIVDVSSYGDGFRLPEYMTAAQTAAEKSAVLLKNDNTALPIKADAGKILLVGHLANSKLDQAGSWSGWVRNGTTVDQVKAEGVVTPYESFLAKFPSSTDATKPDDSKFAYLEGYTTTLWKDGYEEADEKVMKETLDAIDSNVAYIVYYAGENADQNGEASSRTNLTLSLNQATLLHQIKNKLVEESLPAKLILVVQTGRPNILSWEDANCDAILQFWAPGSMGGPALLSLLYGEATPSGKLPVTFPRNVGQIPISYSDLISGRPYLPTDGIDDGEQYAPGDAVLGTDGSVKYASRYIDSKVSPLYVFGYGLSYTTFTYEASVSPISASANSNDTFTINVQVTNEDTTIAADEIVQIYVKTRISKMAPHKKRLRQFERVSFAKGDGPKTVEFTLSVQEDFGYFNNALQWVVEAGVYDLFVAKASDDETNAFTITLT